jgi:hypothetical protein
VNCPAPISIGACCVGISSAAVWARTADVAEVRKKAIARSEDRKEQRMGHLMDGKVGTAGR